MSAESQKAPHALQKNKFEEMILNMSVMDRHKLLLGAWTFILATDWAVASLKGIPCLSSIWLLRVLPYCNIILAAITSIAWYRSRWLDARFWALDLESELAATKKALADTKKVLEDYRNQTKAGLHVGESNAKSVATSLDNSPTKSDQHPTTEDGESSEAWYVVDMEEVSQSLDQDPAEPRHETQDSTQPSIASAVRVLSQSPIEWLAGRIFLLLDGMLTHDTSQSTHKQPEKLPSSSDVSAATQTPYTGAMRMHQDCTSEEGLKLVLANPLEYLQSLLDAIGFACFGLKGEAVRCLSFLQAIVIALRLCYNWVAGSSGIGWFVPMYPSLAGLCCTVMVLVFHADESGLLPWTRDKSVHGPAATTHSTSEGSSPQPLQLQLPCASRAEAQTVPESSIESIAAASADSVAKATSQPVAEATPQPVVEATPKSVAQGTPEPIARTTPPSVAKATLLSRLEAALEAFEENAIEPATALATDIAAVVSDELKFELDSSKKAELILPAGWEDKGEEFGKVYFEKELNKEYVAVVFTAQGHGIDNEKPDEDVFTRKVMQLRPEIMTLKVCVYKESSDDALMFEVAFDGNSIKILKVTLEEVDEVDDVIFEDVKEEKKDENEDRLTICNALVFSEPNKRQARIQQAFKTYLEEQGVDAELIRGLTAFQKNKTQTLSPQGGYIDWLIDLQKFLEQ